jgi:hypothetical protein
MLAPGVMRAGAAGGATRAIAPATLLSTLYTPASISPAKTGTSLDLPIRTNKQRKQYAKRAVMVTRVSSCRCIERKLRRKQARSLARKASLQIGKCVA